MVWTAIIIVIIIAIYWLKPRKKQRAKLIEREDIFSCYDRKYWEYRIDRPIKLKETAEAYIRYNGEVCAMKVADYGSWEFKYLDNYKLLHPHKEHPYGAYRPTRFCIYKGYVYILDVWGEVIVLNPRSNKTRTHLQLSDTDRRVMVMLYKDFIASSPTVWEERSRIRGFKFDVEPKVFLYKEGAYIEENLQDAWHKQKN
ncbi:MAG: hypothetical protein HG458_007560 [Prevotella sp.]|nr:hypothetical protein [Prevotella sp.]